MIFKIKEIFLIIFLIFLQSCSGGRIGNFLEESFDDLENINKKEDTINLVDNNKVLNQENKEINKKNIEEKQTKKTSKSTIDNKKLLNSENKEINKKNIEEKKKEKTSKSLIDNIKNSEKIKKTRKTYKDNKSHQKENNKLQSYKIIFILKDVDPKDPIEELSTILRNSEVNFEIEKIERILDSKNKSINKN